jgi:hypothetical protein
MSATNWPIAAAWMMYDDECGAVGGMKIDRKTEVLRENLPRRHFIQQRSHVTRPGDRTRAGD